MDNRLAVRRIMWAVLALNSITVLVKLALSYLTGSVVLRGDAYFTAVDLIVDVMIIASVFFASRPPDKSHPYGHHKFEAIAVAIVAVLIFVALQDLGYQTWQALRGAHLPEGSTFFIIVLAVTLAVNTALALYELHFGKKLNSSALRADGWYTMTGCALTALAIISLAAASAGLGWPDLAGAAVALVMIAAAGWVVARDALAALSDQARLDEQLVIDTVISVDGVSSCHGVRSRGLPESIYVDLHMLVAPQLSTLEAHQLAHKVESAVMERFPGVIEVVVHVEPGTLH